MMLYLTGTRNCKISSQLSFAPNDKLVLLRAGMNNCGFETGYGGISGDTVNILRISIDFSTCLLDRLF